MASGVAGFDGSGGSASAVSGTSPRARKPAAAAVPSFKKSRRPEASGRGSTGVFSGGVFFSLIAGLRERQGRLDRLDAGKASPVPGAGQRFLAGLVREGLASAEDADVLDAGGQDAVAELEEKPRAGDDVDLDGGPAPGAAVDGGGGGGR